MFSGSWKTTVIGILAGIVNYVAMLGPNLPSDAKGWGAVMVSGLLAALGITAKDGNVSNAREPLAHSQAVVPAPAPLMAQTAQTTKKVD